MSLGQRLTPDISRRQGDLDARIAALEAIAAELPSRWAGGASSPQVSLQIIGGNTLSDGVTAGIKWALGGVSTVPSVYDPNVTSSFIDGIGRAYLYLDNVLQSGIVLVGNYSGNGGPIIRPLVRDELVFASPNTVQIPLSGDPTKSVSVYVPASP